MVRERVDALRELMKEEEVDAYLVPSTDPHASEYVPACWERRMWISGFTGSAGEVLITMDQGDFGRTAGTSYRLRNSRTRGLVWDHKNIWDSPNLDFSVSGLF